MFNIFFLKYILEDFFYNKKSTTNIKILDINHNIIVLKSKLF